MKATAQWHQAAHLQYLDLCFWIVVHEVLHLPAQGWGCHDDRWCRMRSNRKWKVKKPTQQVEERGWKGGLEDERRGGVLWQRRLLFSVRSYRTSLGGRDRDNVWIWIKVLNIRFDLIGKFKVPNVLMGPYETQQCLGRLFDANSQYNALLVMRCHGCRSERGPKCRHNFSKKQYLFQQTSQDDKNTDQTERSHTGNETNRVYIHRQAEVIGQRGTRHRWTQW